MAFTLGEKSNLYINYHYPAHPPWDSALKSSQSQHIMITANSDVLVH